MCLRSWCGVYAWRLQIVGQHPGQAQASLEQTRCSIGKEMLAVRTLYMR